MGQEFFINSQELEDKVRQLLPSQGNKGAGFDLSASTQIVPIIDLTESAEGSNVRADLQTALSFNSATAFDENDNTSTIITNTGYWRVTGVATAKYSSTTGTNEEIAAIILNDGSSDKTVWAMQIFTNNVYVNISESCDHTIFLPAGHSIKIQASTANVRFKGSIRQIADVDGNLVNP